MQIMTQMARVNPRAPEGVPAAPALTRLGGGPGARADSARGSRRPRCARRAEQATRQPPVAVGPAAPAADPAGAQRRRRRECRLQSLSDDRARIEVAARQRAAQPAERNRRRGAAHLTRADHERGAGFGDSGDREQWHHFAQIRLDAGKDGADAGTARVCDPVGAAGDRDTEGGR